MKTNAPSLTKSLAVASPIPSVPPVTAATFPCSLPMVVPPSVAVFIRVFSGEFGERRRLEAGPPRHLSSSQHESSPSAEAVGFGGPSQPGPEHAQRPDQQRRVGAQREQHGPCRRVGYRGFVVR